MKLYDAQLSPASQFARMIAQEVGVSLEVVPVDMSSGEHTKAGFRKINPNGRVPALVDGDFRLWESNAIATYIAAQKPEAGLLPTDLKGRADVDRWLFWKSCHLGPAFFKIAFERLMKPKFFNQPTDEKVVAQGYAELNEFAPILNDHLSRHSYLVNDRLSVADFSLASTFTYRKMAEVDISAWPHVASWLERMEKRPSWVAHCVKF